MRVTHSSFLTMTMMFVTIWSIFVCTTLSVVVANSNSGLRTSALASDDFFFSTNHLEVEEHRGVAITSAQVRSNHNNKYNNRNNSRRSALNTNNSSRRPASVIPSASSASTVPARRRRERLEEAEGERDAESDLPFATNTTLTNVTTASGGEIVASDASVTNSTIADVNTNTTNTTTNTTTVDGDDAVEGEGEGEGEDGGDANVVSQEGDDAVSGEAAGSDADDADDNAGGGSADAAADGADNDAANDDDDLGTGLTFASDVSKDAFLPLSVNSSSLLIEKKETVSGLAGLDVDAFDFGFALMLSEELTKKLNDAEKPFTLFMVPSTDFNNIPEGMREHFLDEKNQKLMDYFLAAHIVNETLTLDDLRNKTRVEAMNGESLKITKQPTAAGKKIKLNTPPSPLAANATNQTTTSDETNSFIDSGVRVNGNPLVKASVGRNGVVYLMKGVLMPSLFVPFMEEHERAIREHRSPQCTDSPQISSMGATCLDLATGHLCNTTLSELSQKYNVPLPDDVPAWLRLSDACMLTCDTCIKGFKKPPHAQRPPTVCDDDPRVAATGPADCAFIAARYGCDMRLLDVVNDAGATTPPGVPPLALVEDACRLTCDRCRPGTTKARIVPPVDHVNSQRVCADDGNLEAFGVHCEYLVAGYTCDGLLAQLASDFKVELPSSIPATARVKDACRASCRHCPPGWRLLPSTPAVPPDELSVRDILEGMPELSRARELSGEQSLQMLSQLSKVTVIVPHDMAFDAQPADAVDSLFATLMNPRNVKERTLISQHSAIPGRLIKSSKFEPDQITAYTTAANQALRIGFQPLEGIFENARNDDLSYEYTSAVQMGLNSRSTSGEAGHTKESAAPYAAISRVPGFTDDALDTLDKDIEALRTKLSYTEPELPFRGPGSHRRYVFFNSDEGFIGSTLHNRDGRTMREQWLDMYKEDGGVFLKLKNKQRRVSNGGGGAGGIFVKNQLNETYGAFTINNNARVVLELHAYNGVVLVVDNSVLPEFFARPPPSHFFFTTPGFENIGTLMMQSGMIDMADSNGPVTLLLAPDSGVLNPYTDDPLPQCILAGLARPEGRMYLEQIMTFIAIPGLHYAADIFDGQLLPTMSGTPIRAIRSQHWLQHKRPASVIHKSAQGSALSDDEQIRQALYEYNVRSPFNGGERLESADGTSENYNHLTEDQFNERLEAAMNDNELADFEGTIYPTYATNLFQELDSSAITKEAVKAGLMSDVDEVDDHEVNAQKEKVKNNGGYNAENGGYLYFEDPHYPHRPVGVVQADIKHSRGLIHIVDTLPLHPDADPRAAGFWACIDSALRLRQWMTKYALPMLDCGMRMPLLGLPPGRRPNWVASNLKHYYPPPGEYPTKDRVFFY